MTGYKVMKDELREIIKRYEKDAWQESLKYSDATLWYSVYMETFAKTVSFRHGMYYNVDSKIRRELKNET